MEPNRSVPYSTEAENYVLGSAFLDNKLISGYIGKLVEDDFYDERNKKIYRAMVNLYNQNQKIELLTITEELKKIGEKVDENYRVYLLDLIESVPSTVTTNLYVEIVEEKSLQRKLLKDMQNISDDILTSRLTFNEVLDKTEDKLVNLIRKRRTSQIMGIDRASEIVYEQIQKYTENKSDLTGLDTGYEKLNKLTLGFQKGDLMILAARPSVGKSTYAINLAAQASKKGAHVALFSLEMSIEQLMMRLFSYQAEVELSNVRGGKLSSEEMLLLGLAKQEFSKMHIYFDEDSSSNIADIRAKCRQLKNEGKLDFVIIDYLQLITATSNRGNRQEEVSIISRSLKTLARDLDVPILALSQLSRSIEGRENKVPVLADLRESGSIEQDADLVMFLFRRADVEDNSVFGDEESENNLEQKNKRKNEMEEIVLSVAKNRQGPLDFIDYHFYGKYCRFKEQKITKELITKKKRRKKTDRSE